MALIDCKDPVYDRRTNKILSMLEEGIEKENIAKELGYTNPISLDNYMRRRNFAWDSRQRNFIPAAEKYSGQGRDNLLQLRGVSKVALIISLFTEEDANPKDIADQVGLSSHTELGTYMKRKGYEWDSLKGNYVKVKNEVVDDEKIVRTTIEKDGSLENILMNIMGTLNEIKESTKSRNGVAILTDTKTLPRHQIRGGYGTKAVRMSAVLDEMIKNYSQEKNISQKDLIEIALVDFFRKYGEGEILEEFLN